MTHQTPRQWGVLDEDFTPCGRCGWPIDVEGEPDAVAIDVDGTTKMFHLLCAPGPEGRRAREHAAVHHGVAQACDHCGLPVDPHGDTDVVAQAGGDDLVFHRGCTHLPMSAAARLSQNHELGGEGG